jgi:hypothetical protein
MNGKRFWFTASIFAVLVVGAGIAALAQDPQPPQHLSGIISDYTPLLPTSFSPQGPWEMRGHWSLDLKGRSSKADFSAYMTMELSDSGVAQAKGDPTKAASRLAHTHHIVMTDATVSTDPVDLTDITKCPSFSPANTPRFVVMGAANFISGNGNDAPFEKNGTSLSTLYVCISGATYDQPGVITPEVKYSNMTVVMVGPAADKHFGPNPINGVVRFTHKDNGDDHGHDH